MKTKKQKKVKTNELVIRVQQDSVQNITDLTEPMRNGTKLTIPKTWVSEGQLTKILQKTPAQYVYKRPGKGGGTFEYVTVAYVQKALNYIFGWNWDFEILQQGIEGGQVWVLGKLTVRGTREGQTIVKTQYGRADIKYKKGETNKPREMLDFGNDLKGATSDCLKKCASMIGIASDIYGKMDYKDETSRDVGETKTKSTTPAKPQNLKSKIMFLVKELGIDPLSDIEKEIRKITKLDPSNEDNLPEIVNRLEITLQERK